MILKSMEEFLKENFKFSFRVKIESGDNVAELMDDEFPAYSRNSKNEFSFKSKKVAKEALARLSDFDLDSEVIETNIK
jgi:hypothetical protein